LLSRLKLGLVTLLVTLPLLSKAPLRFSVVPLLRNGLFAPN